MKLKRELFLIYKKASNKYYQYSVEHLDGISVKGVGATRYEYGFLILTLL